MPELTTPATQSPSSAEDIIKQANEAIKNLPNSQKLDIFFRLAISGKDVMQAMHEARILTPDQLGYDPSSDLIQNLEELYYARCVARLPTKDEVIAYREAAPRSHLDVQEFQLRIIRDEHRSADLHPLASGWITTTQLFKLVDWLYFVRALPLGAIAQTIRIPLDIIISVKAELSNESAKAIRRQSADGYIADLARTKELIRQDLIYRRSKAVSGSTTVAIDKLLWQLENDYVDRLQDIGIIDRNLGKVEVHEEWHVTIGTSGQPINEKLKRLEQSELPAFLRDDTSSSYKRSGETIETSAIALDEKLRALKEESENRVQPTTSEIRERVMAMTSKDRGEQDAVNPETGGEPGESKSIDSDIPVQSSAQGAATGAGADAQPIIPMPTTIQVGMNNE